MSHPTNSRRIVSIIYQSLGFCAAWRGPPSPLNYLTHSSSVQLIQLRAQILSRRISHLLLFLCNLLPSLMFLHQPYNLLAMVQLFFTLKIHLVFMRGAKLPALKTAAWCSTEQAQQGQGGCAVWYWHDNASHSCISCAFHEAQSSEVNEVHLQTNSFLTF